MRKEREAKDFLGHSAYVGYNGDGHFYASTIGCGCCSDTHYKLTREEAIAICDSMIERYQKKKEEMLAITDETIKADTYEEEEEVVLTKDDFL